MTVLDVSAAIDSRDCDWPDCDRESERDGRCRYHAGRTYNGQRTDDDPEPKETPVSACKIDGCTEEPGLDKRGPYTGLCSAHKREKAAAMGAARRAERQPTPAAPVAPAATSNGHQPLTLVQLAQAVEQADADILAALERRSRAVADLQAWIDADE